MQEILRNTYKGKRVFVTGHTGFKGAWLIKILTMLGAEVKGFALSPENDKDLFNMIEGSSIIQSIIGDLRDRDKLQREVLAFEPEFIFHLAAQPLVRLSYELSYETFEVNALGTAALLETLKMQRSNCNVVLITTDKVYHNREWLYPYREDDRLGGYDPYSASKACAELLIDSYRNSFFNPAKYSDHGKAIAIGRAGNVIGGGDWAKDRLIPDIVRFLSAGQDIVVRNPRAVRPWQHVLEPLAGYLLLGAKLANEPIRFSQAYNFGPTSNDTLPVLEMVESAIACWGSGTYSIASQNGAHHEAGLLKLDISKAEGELNWSPRYKSSTALEKTIDWYKTFITSPGEIVRLTESQINEFFHE